MLLPPNRPASGCALRRPIPPKPSLRSGGGNEPRRSLLHRLLLAFALSSFGCAGHAAHTLEARSALDAGNPERALALINEQLEVDSAKELPKDPGGDRTLFLLDRAMILQELGQYQLSSRDLEVSDKQIEVLDFSSNVAADLGKYLYSSDTGPYKAPAYEKLLINTVNMVNYLVRGDLNGARIEARRFAVMQKFIREHDDKAISLMGPGSYFSGFIFEKSGRPEEALRYYDEALAHEKYASLREPVRRLLRNGSYRSPRLTTLAGEGTAAPPNAEDAEVLVVASYGRVPAKYAKRIPIGLALTYTSGLISPADHARANRLAAQGLVTWINYPELGRPRGQYDHPSGSYGSQSFEFDAALAVDREAIRAWEEARGAIVASAITRMLTRVVAGEVANKAAGEGVVGALLSLGTQVALTAADTPDTRSWATLPARIAIARFRLPAGKHTFIVSARGLRRTREVNLTPGGWAAINLTALN